MLFTHDGSGDDEDGRRASPWFVRARWYGFLVLLTAVQLFGSVMASQHGASWQDEHAHGQPPGYAGQPIDGPGVALLLVGPVLLLLVGPHPVARRRLPVVVFFATMVATGGFYVLGYTGPAVLSLMVATGSVVLVGRRLVGWLGSACGLLLFFGVQFARSPETPPSLVGVTTVSIWAVAVLGAAELIRMRRERRADTRRTRLEERRRRATEERLVIAQELHDVLAHNISMMNVQASVGLHLMDEKPEQARTALSAIKQASGEALGELRSVLDVLRAGAAAPRTPAAGLDGLQMLQERAAAAGLDVRIEHSGRPRELPAPVQLAAFRVVQESLTNVVRHAQATAVTVDVNYGEQVLAVTVDDDGLGPQAASTLPGTGSGIEGMRRRAVALGGTLDAGPRAEGGFRVAAVIPADGT